MPKGVPEDVVSYWNVRARDGYDRQPGQDAARELWASRIGPLITEAAGPGSRILDTGCGTGFLARLLATDGHHVTGQDVSLGMLQVAAERAAAEELTIEWSLGPAEEPPDGPFDAVVSRNVLWTLPDPHATLRALWTVLRPGGLVLLSDAVWGQADIGDKDTEQRFVSCYTEASEALPLSEGLGFAECAALVRSAGFEEVTDHTALFARTPYPSAPGFFLMTARAIGTGVGTPAMAERGVDRHGV